MESLENTVSEIREDIRESRAENREAIRELRAEMRDIRSDMQEGIRAHQTEMRDIRSKIDRQFLWVLGIMFTMWISLFALITTFMTAIINKLGG